MTIPSPLTPSEGQKQLINRMYGMFLHFGLNTFINLQWSDGNIPASKYAPLSIDTDQWVRTAYEAGMNYVILIAKHHDGFCLWPSRYTNYNVAHSRNRTDVVQEVYKACQKYGLELGLYYSLWDRNAPSYINDFPKGYIDYMCNQLTELLDSRYGKIVELWFDGGWDKAPQDWQLGRVYKLIKQLQPNCQVGVNQTIDDKTTAGMPDENHFLPNKYQEGFPIKYFPSDFRLWDPHLTRKDDPKLYSCKNQLYYMPFEATICSRNGFSWFWSNEYEKEPLMDAEFIANCYRHLTAQDNVLVVNCGPNKEGKLVPADIDNLMLVADKLGIKRKWKR